MPKKPTTARSGAQRSKQKSFELVRPAGQERAQVLDEPQSAPDAIDETPVNVVPLAPSPSRSSRERQSESAALVSTPEIERSNPLSNNAPKGSASARLAARRLAAQKVQQRNSVALLTPEHFSYVKRDLVIIAILAVIMFTAIIVLYLTVGRA